MQRSLYEIIGASDWSIIERKQTNVRIINQKVKTHFLVKKKCPYYLFQYALVGWHLFSAESKMHIKSNKNDTVYR
jgi:hypothetical protein